MCNSNIHFTICHLFIILKETAPWRSFPFLSFSAWHALICFLSIFSCYPYFMSMERVVFGTSYFDRAWFLQLLHGMFSIHTSIQFFGSSNVPLYEFAKFYLSMMRLYIERYWVVYGFWLT